MQTILRRTALGILAVVIVLSGAIIGLSLAEAGGCRHVRVRSSGDQILLIPSYSQEGYAYQVGSDLQIEAIAEKVAARVLAQLAAAQQQGPAAQAPPAADEAAQPAPQSLGILEQKCSKCHDGTNPDRVQLVGVPLTCETSLEAIRRLLLDQGSGEHMPKGGQLTAQELGDLIGELSGAK